MLFHLPESSHKEAHRFGQKNCLVAFLVFFYFVPRRTVLESVAILAGLSIFAHLPPVAGAKLHLHLSPGQLLPLGTRKSHDICGNFHRPLSVTDSHLAQSISCRDNRRVLIL
jgi:hypothetical protein